MPAGAWSSIERRRNQLPRIIFTSFLGDGSTAAADMPPTLAPRRLIHRRLKAPAVRAASHIWVMSTIGCT
jgi:hypothetical protein